jgi:hypothetical protein
MRKRLKQLGHNVRLSRAAQKRHGSLEREAAVGEVGVGEGVFF